MQSVVAQNVGNLTCSLLLAILHWAIIGGNLNVSRFVKFFCCRNREKKAKKLHKTPAF
jgi:hypothetical protein